MANTDEMILADLVRKRAEERPDLDVLTFEHFSLDSGATPDEVLTFGELAERANRIAAALLERGIGPGDRFAIVMDNRPEFVECMVAASITGSIFVPIDPRMRGERLAFLLRKSGCSGAVVTADGLSAVAEVCGSLPDLRWVLCIEPWDAEAGDLRVEPLREVLERPAPVVDRRAEGPKTPLQIMFTSGTTGDPKGIVGSNERFCRAGMLGYLFGYRPDDRPYTGLSLTHGNAQAMTLAPSLLLGLRAVFSRRFTKSKLWDICRRYGCTTFSLLGGMATAIYSEPPRPDDADNPVRLVISGGMPPAIWEAFERRFGVQILEIYGAMDGGGMAFKPPGVGPIGSFGKPIPGTEMKILDEEGNECPPGVIGEICVRVQQDGAGSVEYYADPEASQRKIRNGWNRSGDMGHRDEEGWLYFDYRKGGGIRRNGEFIVPSQVEKVIAEVAGVSDVFVYGVPAASGAPGEKDLVAAVVFEPGRRDPDRVFEACRRNLKPNFVPSYLQILEEIPKTASEKPRENLLRDAFDPAAPNVVPST